MKLPLDKALTRIGDAGKFSIAYDASIIKADRPVTLKVHHTTIKNILDEILGKEIRYKQVGNHVILMKEMQMATWDQKKVEYKIYGIIYNSETREPLSYATVYQVDHKITSMTDENGRYHLLLPAGKGAKSITYCKTGFYDTIVFVPVLADLSKDLYLRPRFSGIPKIETKTAILSISGIDTLEIPVSTKGEVDEFGIVKWLVPATHREIGKNLEIHGNRAFQVSLIPYIGTNGKSSGSMSNAVSINLLAGYSRETNGFELGGLLNIDRQKVNGFQLGGLGNFVGGSITGFQLGGLFNIDLGPVHGFQMTGLFNYLPDSLKGFQLSGLCNISKGKMKGFQMTGLCNITTRHMDGWQISGLGNFGKHEINGAQISGLFNYGHDNRGFQLSGIMNVAKRDNRGAQIAGIFNYTRRLNGFQLALFNYAETLETGVPIGFLSIVRHGGYYKFEVAADEVFYLNVAYLGGTSRFYNIFKTGIGDSLMVNFTYGFGTHFPVSKVFSMGLDLTTGVVMTTTTGLKYHGMEGKLGPTFDFRLAKHFSIFFGPTANIYWFNTGNSLMPEGIAPYTFYDHTFTTGPHRIQLWIGGVIGMKI